MLETFIYSLTHYKAYERNTYHTRRQRTPPSHQSQRQKNMETSPPSRTTKQRMKELEYHLLIVFIALFFFSLLFIIYHYSSHHPTTTFCDPCTSESRKVTTTSSGLIPLTGNTVVTLDHHPTRSWWELSCDERAEKFPPPLWEGISNYDHSHIKVDPMSRYGKLDTERGVLYTSSDCTYEELAHELAHNHCQNTYGHPCKYHKQNFQSSLTTVGKMFIENQ